MVPGRRAKNEAQQHLTGEAQLTKMNDERTRGMH